jgi:acyl dehydratase
VQEPEAGVPAVRITREDLIRFSRAIGQTDPLFVDVAAARAAGHPDLPAPPTYLFGLTLRGEDPWRWAVDAGLDMARALHGEQGFTYDATVHAGDLLTFTTTTAEVDSTRSGLRRVRRRVDVWRAGVRVARLSTTLVMPA